MLHYENIRVILANKYVICKSVVRKNLQLHPKEKPRSLERHKIIVLEGNDKVKVTK